VIPLSRLKFRSSETRLLNLGALNVTLEADHMARLEAVSRIDLGFPHDFLSGGEVQRLIYGGTGDQIDAPRP
jgi:hypothetical protein